MGCVSAWAAAPPPQAAAGNGQASISANPCTQVRQLQLHKARVNDLCLDEEGEFLASASDDGAVTVRPARALAPSGLCLTTQPQPALRTAPTGHCPPCPCIVARNCSTHVSFVTLSSAPQVSNLYTETNTRHELGRSPVKVRHAACHNTHCLTPSCVPATQPTTQQCTPLQLQQPGSLRATPPQ
jgi:hypothetical protein